jgi:uncharacterized protein YgiM (DUF1202 family)
MRKVLSTVALCSAAVLATVVPAQAATASPQSKPAAAVRPAAAPLSVFCTYRVTADWLRYRTGPGTNYPALGQYQYGTVLTAYRDDVQNGFRHLANGYWSASQYLQRTGGSCFE